MVKQKDCILYLPLDLRFFRVRSKAVSSGKDAKRSNIAQLWMAIIAAKADITSFDVDDRREPRVRQSMMCDTKV
jgi:hypothetical protein